MLRSYRSRLVYLLPVALLVVTSAVVGDKLDDPCAISPESCPVTVQIGLYRVLCPNMPIMIQTGDMDAHPWDPNEPPHQWLTFTITDPNGQVYPGGPIEMSGGVYNLYEPNLPSLLGTSSVPDGQYIIEAWASDAGSGGSYEDQNTAHDLRVIYLTHDPNCCTRPCNSAPEHDCNGNGVDDDCDIGCGFSGDCNDDGLPDECDPNTNCPVKVNIGVWGAVRPGTWITITTSDIDARPWDSPEQPPCQQLYVQITDRNGIVVCIRDPNDPYSQPLCGESDNRFDFRLQGKVPPCDTFCTIEAWAWDVDGGHAPADPNVAYASRLVYVSDDPNCGEGQCALGQGPDCNGNGVNDAWDLRCGVSIDCDGNGKLDECDCIDDPNRDCDNNRRLDECVACTALDVVFIVDTSKSMCWDTQGLCCFMDRFAYDLRYAGTVVNYEVLRISPDAGCESPAPEYQDDGSKRLGPECPPSLWCCDPDDSVCTRYGRYSLDPNDPNDPNELLGLCPNDPNDGRTGYLEDWGPACAIVAANKDVTNSNNPWHANAVRVIIPISDEGPRCGCPVDPNDENAISYSIDVVRRHHAIVSPIIGTSENCALEGQDPNVVFPLAQALAGASGGTVVEFSDSNSLTASITQILHAVCKATDCNGNGIPDACEADADHDGVPDDCEISPLVKVWRNDDPNSISVWDPNTATATAGASECDVLRLDASETQGALAGGLLFEWDLNVGGDPNHPDFSPPDVYGPEFEYSWRAEGVNESPVVSLRISTATGMATYATVRLTIADSTPLLASLTGPTELTVGQTGRFIATPASRCDDVVSVTWDFRDGNQPVIGAQIPRDLEQCRSWSTVDPNYVVTCTITDSDGDTSSRVLHVQVTDENPPYQARATELQVERQYHVYDPNFTEGSLSVRHSAELRVKNIGEYPVPGPIHVAFEGLTPAGTELAGGSTDPNLGAPHIQIAGAEVTLTPQQASEWTWVEWQIPIESTEAFSYDAVAYTLQLPPVFRTEPPHSVAEGEVCTYEALAEDPEGEPVYYELVAPVPAGMRINSASGLLTWPVGHSAANDSPYSITIRAHDAYAYTNQIFQLDVTAVNAPPFVKEAPQLTAAAGGSYESRIVVEDPEGGDANAQYTVPQGMVVAPDPNQANTWNLTWSPVTEPDFTLSFHFTDAGQPSGSNQQAIDASYLVVVTDCNYPHISRDPLNNLEQAVEGQPYIKQIHLLSGGPQSAYYFLDQAPAAMTINPTGLIQWLPPYTAAGTPVVRVRVSDDPAGVGGCFDTYAFNIRVDNRNAAPVVTSCPSDPNVSEGAVYTYHVTADDPDGDVLDFRLLDGPRGMRIDPATGLLRWVPSQTAAQHSPYHIRIEVRDTAGVAAEVPATCPGALDYYLTVDPVDVPPIFTSTPINFTPEDEPYVYTLAAMDLDGDALEFVLRDGPPGMELWTENGVSHLEWLPASPGVYPVRVEVREVEAVNTFDEQPFTISVYWVPQPNEVPYPASFDPPLVAEEDSTYTAELTAVDPNGPSEGMALRFVTHPPGMTCEVITDPPPAEHERHWHIQWTPTEYDVGFAHDVTLAVTDEQGAGFQRTWSIFVFPPYVPNDNRRPEILSWPTYAAAVGQQYLFALQAYDPDPNDHVSFETMPAKVGGHGGPLVAVPSGFEVHKQADTLAYVTWLPTAEQVGLHWVAVKVEDKFGSSVTLNWTLWVSDGPTANRPPRITSEPVRSAAPNVLYQYLVGFEDPDVGDSHTFTLSRQPIGATVHPITGLIEWTPTEAQFGQHEFAVRITDGDGAWYDQPYDVLVSVSGDDAPPIIKSTPRFVVPRGALYSYCLSVEDEDQDGLSYSLLQGPSGMALSTAPNPLNCLTWSTTNASPGTYSVVVRVTDSAGGWDEQAFSVTVFDPETPNSPPHIISSAGQLARIDQSWTYFLRATDEEPNGLQCEVLQRPAGTSVGAMAPDPNDPNAMQALLTWMPTADQAGQQPFVIRVTDEQRAWCEQRFEVVASVSGLNHTPCITTAPPTTVRCGDAYVYDVIARDPDPGDQLSYALRPDPGTPLWMQFDSVQASRLVLPTSTDLNNSHYLPVAAYPVTIRVTDREGAWVEQPFNIAVTDANAPALNHPPQFISLLPEQPARVGQSYTFDLVGFDQDDNPLTFSQLDPNRPVPQSVPDDATRATFTWTPNAGDAGRVPIKFGLCDNKVTVYKTIEILVLGPGGNYPPRITSTPVFNMKLGRPYRYQATAEDPEGGVLTWQLAVAATHMDMLSIDSATGLVTSTEANQPLEPCTVDVAVFVADPQGSYAQQPYTIDVRANEAPRIVSTPVRQGVVGEQYRYAVIATDPDSRMGELHYTLAWLGQGPEPNAQIDPNSGLINWTPTAAATYPFRVTVTDECGALDTQEFAVRVVSGTDADLFAPTISIAVDREVVQEPNKVEVTICVQDDRPIPGNHVLLTVTKPDQSNDPNDLTLDPNGQVSVEKWLTAVGVYQFEAKVVDAGGQERRAFAKVRTYPAASDPNQPLTAVLVDPNHQLDGDGYATDRITEVSGRYQVRGRVFGNHPNDPNVGFWKWTLGYFTAEEPNTQIEFACGYQPFTTDSDLAIFDTTLLPNGMYRLRLTAWNLAEAPAAFDDVDVVVTGEAKVGHFELTFTDLEVPIAGVPIRVLRTYDSRIKTTRDFGQGWKLELSSLTAQESTDMAEGWPVFVSGYWQCSVAARVAHTVSVSLPGQRTESFLLHVNGKSGYQTGACSDVQVDGLSFEPLSQATSELRLLGANPAWVTSAAGNYDANDQNILGWTDGQHVTHWQPDGYVLKAKDGTQYEFTRRVGRVLKLSKVIGLNGNTLEISDDQIVSNGIAVQIHRRPDGRVTEVVDPEGNAITYEYDTPGRLISVTDRERNKTTFTYDYNNTLVEIIDPRGVPVARNDYDADGRLVATTDAAGNKTTFEHHTIAPPDPNDGSVGYELITDRNNTATAHYYDAQGNVTREVHYSDPNGQNEICRTSHSYDPNYGNLLETTDALGRMAKNEYNDSNNPTKVTRETDFEGRVTEYTYNQFGQVTDVTRTGAGTTHSEYDATSGNLKEVRDPGNAVTTYDYDAWGNVTTIRDALDNPSQMTYDERGRLLTRTDALNNVTTYNYDDRRQWETRTRTVNGAPEEIVSFSETDLDGRTIRQVDPLGHEVTTTYTAGGQTETVTNVNGTTEYEYTVRGELATVFYPDDSTESYTYDAGGRRDMTTDRDGRKVQSVYDGLGRLARTVYIDPNTPDPNNCPTCPHTETVYDLIGRVQSRFDENHAETRYNYHDPNDHKQTVTNVDRNDPNDPNKSIATVYEYDDAGRLAQMTDNAGKVTRYEYDAAGRPWKTIFHDGTYTETTYDLLGRKKTQRDQAGLETKFDYDELGRLKKVTDALGQATNYAYDGLGNMTSMTDAEQHETKLAYDKLGRLTTRTLPPVDGQSLFESFDYDTAGNLSTHQRFDGTQITYEHDLDGRVTKKEVTAEQKTYFFHWSPGGRLETVGDDPCNPSDAYGSFQYDARGRLSLEQREDGDKLVYAYDDGGNRTDVALAPRWEDPNRPTWQTHYEYDGHSRLKTVSEVLDPNGSATSKLIGEYFYDAVGNLEHVTLGNGTAVEYGYDDLHRLTSVKNYRDYGGTAETVISSFTYTLGHAGNRTAVTEVLTDGKRRTISYVYDDLYRLKQEWADTRDANNLIVHERQVDYVYDNVGNRQTMTVRETAGETTARYTVTYDYDERDRLTSETRSGTCLTAAVYTRDRAEYAVAKSAQPVPARWAGPALLGFGLITLVCTVFPLLSRTSWRPWRSSRLGGCLSGGCLYGRRYERRRLWTACVSLFFVPQFILGASNLLGLHVEGLEAQALADGSDCGRVVKYFYDANGNLNWRVISRIGQPNDVDRYVFNSEDRLVAYDPNTPYDPNNPGDPNHAADPNNLSTAATRYTYDPDGVRTSKTTGGVTTYYVVDKNRDLPQVLEEREGPQGTLKVRYLYGHDLLAQVRPVGQSQEYSYYHYDGQLSTRQLTDDNPVPAAVTVTNNYTYDAFGADLTHTGLPGNAIGAPENVYRYTGEQHDSPTGFYYLRARYYDATTGRFASRDPFGGLNTDPMSLHKYLYCRANPVDRVDPSGRFDVINALIVVCILAILFTIAQGVYSRHSVTGVNRPTGSRNVLVRISIDTVNKAPTFHTAIVERKLTQLMQKNLNLGAALTIRVVDEQTAPRELMWIRQPEAGFDHQFNHRVTWNTRTGGLVASTGQGETVEYLGNFNQLVAGVPHGETVDYDIAWSNNLAHEVFWIGLGAVDRQTSGFISSGKELNVSAPIRDFRPWESNTIINNLGLPR